MESVGCFIMEDAYSIVGVHGPTRNPQMGVLGGASLIMNIR